MAHDFRTIRNVPPALLRRERVLVQVDAANELEMQQSLPTFALLSSAGAQVTVVTGECERPIECDIFCNEAFSLSHEVRRSTTTVAHQAKLAVAGLGFEQELSQLEAVLNPPQSPVIAVLGGELSTNKLSLAALIARRADRVFIGGELCIPFLLAKQIPCKSKTASAEMVSLAAQIIDQAGEDKRSIATPDDFTVLNENDFKRFSGGEQFPFGPPLRHVEENEIQVDDIICDIGPVTQWNWSDNLGLARTIFWHGPLGMTETDIFSEGTRFFAAALAGETGSLHDGIVCGRSLTAAIRRAHISIGILRYLSPAASAALHYFAGQPLPAVDVLRERARGRLEPRRILIPLDGTNRDADLITTAARLLTADAHIFLLHVRTGWDEERYPDFRAAMTEAERYTRRVESERIFGRANAILAEHGLISSAQNAAQGKPREIISRYAKQLGAEVIVERGRSTVLLMASL